MFFVIVKIVRPDTRTGLSYIKSKMYNMKMYQFKQYIPIANLQIEEWMNNIYISGRTY